jgi:hypothetical protein
LAGSAVWRLLPLDLYAARVQLERFCARRIVPAAPFVGLVVFLAREPGTLSNEQT